MPRRVFARRLNEKPGHSGLYAEELTALSTYNTERDRGLAHDPDYAEQMAELQARFDTATGVTPTPEPRGLRGFSLTYTIDDDGVHLRCDACGQEVEYPEFARDLQATVEDARRHQCPTDWPARC